MTYPPGFSKDSLWGFFGFFVFSLLFHLAILLIVPNFLSVKQIEIIPVIYRQPFEVRLKKLPPMPSSKAKKTQKKQKTEENKGTSQFIKKKIQTISLGKGLFLPPPSIQLPVSEVLHDQEKIEELYTSRKEPEERLGTTVLNKGVPNILPKVAPETSALTSPQADKEYTENLVRELKHQIRAEAKQATSIGRTKKTPKKQVSNVRLGVEGPISERRILYRPPLPQVSTEQTVQIKLKFWVAPNGIVDQVIPVERGGAKLEAVAVNFLKKWRFEPLPAEEKQERQWGILTVKFVVK